jgi:hypothetical protein
MTADNQVWSESGLQYEVDDGVAWLRLNRPALAGQPGAISCGYYRI